MSQPAKQPSVLIAAAPVKDAPSLTTVVTRPLPRDGKRLTGPEAESAAVADAAVPAQAVLLSQITGEPLNATGGQVTEQCPVTEPGVADACGLSGAADAHPAAGGGALWALALIPLLGAGGGGGGGGGSVDTSRYTIASYSPVTGLPQSSIAHPVTRTGDEGMQLTDFNASHSNSVFHLIKVVDKNGVEVAGKAIEGTNPLALAEWSNPATAPWFYLDTRDGKVYLTPAGAAATDVGTKYTLTVQAQDGSSSSETATLTFTLIDYKLTPNPVDVLHPIDTLNDNGKVLADFGPDLSGSRYSIVSVTDNNELGSPVNGKATTGSVAYNASTDTNTDPATQPWFYLDDTTGKVSLTKAGAAASCIGESFTIAVQATAADGSKSDIATVSFTLEAPTNAVNHDFVANSTSGLETIYASSDYDVLAVHQGSSDVTQMQFLPDSHGIRSSTNALYVQVGDNFAEIENHFQVGAGKQSLEYLTFVDNGQYYGYDLATANRPDQAGIPAYYKVSQTETTLDAPTLNGTGCDDLLYGSTANDGHDEIINGNAGDDLIFADPLFDGAPGSWLALTNGFVDHVYGGAGNDLLVTGGGNDELNGGTGNDVLIGGFGKDNLIGGAGADKFVFNASTSAADADTITDFNVAEGDQILLDATVFLDSDLLAYSSSSGALSYDGTIFATLSNKPTDFTVSGSVFMV